MPAKTKPVKVKIIADDAQFTSLLTERPYLLRANLDADIRLAHRGSMVIDCGLSMELDDNYKAIISPITSLGEKGLFVMNPYMESGRVKVNVLNLGRELICIKKGDIIAAIDIEPIYKIDFIS